MAGDDVLEHTYITSLSFLPWQPCAYFQCQDKHQQLTQEGLHGSTMDVLDALAAMCVRDSFETYSTALVLQRNEVCLFVSTTGVPVPDVVERRLQSIWQFMRMIHDHDDTVYLRQGDMTGIAVRKLAHDFGVEQYRFSLHALRARLAHDAIIVLDSIRAVLGCHAPHAAYVSIILEDTWHEHDALSDTERQLLNCLTTGLQDMQSAVAAQDLSDEAVFQLLHRTQELNGRVSALLPRSETIFTRIQAICDVPFRYHIRRILWLADPCVVVPAFAISRHFAPIAEMQLRIHKVAPVVQHTA